MKKGTLLVSRAVKLFPHYKKRLEVLGFTDVTVTDVESDGLSMLIREIDPGIVLMSSMFYQCCTSFMMADLHKQFPKLNIAVISTYYYPEDYAMYCIINGAKSYVNFWDGAEQFYQGLEEIKKGHEFIPPEVQRRIAIRKYRPKPTGALTERQIQILRLFYNGFTGAEIAGMLRVSERSIDNRKTEIYTAMNVRNENEAIRAARRMGIINDSEPDFFPRGYELKPLPMKTMSSEK